MTERQDGRDGRDGRDRDDGTPPAAPGDEPGPGDPPLVIAAGRWLLITDDGAWCGPGAGEDR